MTRWQLKTPEGQIYGPVSVQEFEQWGHEGRIDSNCEVRSDEASEWKKAADFFPAITLTSINASSPNSSDASTVIRRDQNDFTRDETHSLLPHRGPLVLALGMIGIISWCPIFSVIAWWMAQSDLKEMYDRRRDSSGNSTTLAGFYSGMVVTFLWIIAIAVTTFLILLRTFVR